MLGTLRLPAILLLSGDAAAEEVELNPLALVYLNRLSDLLFILARTANAGDEPLWKPGTSH